MQDLNKFKNEMNLSGKNVYVGHRYVPKIFGEWDKTKIYEPLSIVQYQGTSFTSRQYVPVGVEITNEDYWALTGNYNAQVEAYRNDVLNYRDDIQNYADNVNELKDELNNASVIEGINDFDNLKQRLKVTTQSINYEMFRKGNLSDSEIIKAAHDYANEFNMPIVNNTGEYYLDEPLNINIQTDVDWGKTIFHIDESKSKQWTRHFWVKNKKEKFILNPTLTQTVFNELNNDSKVITPLAPYKNSLIRIYDNDIRVGNRVGNTNNWEKSDLFYITNDGKLVGDNIWDEYSGVVSVQPLDTPIEIKGGIFKLNGLTSTSDLNVDISPVIYTEKSFVTFKNQMVMIDDYLTDVNTNSINGFYGFNQCYKITIDGSNVLPRKSSSTGTYGIHANHVMDFTINNVTGDGNENSWGVMGSNYIKDLYINKSTLNRVDTHYKLWNLHVEKSQVNKFTLNGGGSLTLRDIKLENNSELIRFRSDYGAKWDGVIDINNVTVIDNGLQSQGFRILDFSGISKTHDYMEELVFAKQIKIHNLNIKSNGFKDVYILYVADWALSDYHHIEFPNYLHFENIKMIDSPDRGVRITNNLPKDYKMSEFGGNQNGRLITNCKMIFKNIDTIDFEVRNDDYVYTTHFSIGALNSTNEDGLNQLVPQVTFENIPYLSVKVFGLYADLIFDNVLLRHLTNRGALGNSSIFKIINSNIEGKMASGGTVILSRGGVENNLFRNLSFIQTSTYFNSIIDGEKKPVEESRWGIIAPDLDFINFNHINVSLTTLDNATVTSEFRNKLWSYQDTNQF